MWEYGHAPRGRIASSGLGAAGSSAPGVGGCVPAVRAAGAPPPLSVVDVVCAFGRLAARPDTRVFALPHTLSEVNACRLERVSTAHRAPSKVGLRVRLRARKLGRERLGTAAEQDLSEVVRVGMLGAMRPLP